MLAVALALLLVSPVFADVFVPPGPANPMWGNQSEWISPTLAAFTWTNSVASSSPIGWDYTTGPTYNALTEVGGLQVPMEDPAVFTSTGLSTSASALASATTWVPYGTQVIVVGFIPGVTVAVDQVPPPVELQINWNGVPNTITLTVPSSQVVGINYPPTMYPNIVTPYQFAYPTTPKQNATYNLWDGNYAQVLAKLWNGATVAPAWWSAIYGPASSSLNGEWFWYAFTPNAGDGIALDSNFQCSTPPTYDITAMFEYGTSQIWFNHVNFNVCELQLHKDLSWCTSQTINDQLNITNVGLVTATNLDLTQTFPAANKLEIYPTSAVVQVVSSTGVVLQPTIALPNFYNLEYPNIYNFTGSGLPAAYTSLAPKTSLIVSLELSVSDTGSGWSGTIVFDSMVSATQIAPWKDPIALAAISYPMGFVPTGTATALWTGLYLGPSSLFGESGNHIDFDMIAAINGVSDTVNGPILRTMLTLPPMVMTLDPSPVPLIAGETSVTPADVALVRSAMLGLAPYDQRMDTNGNGRIDVQDLKAYEAAA